jgi:hypothetical protein
LKLSTEISGGNGKAIGLATLGKPDRRNSQVCGRSARPSQPPEAGSSWFTAAVINAAISVSSLVELMRSWALASARVTTSAVGAVIRILLDCISPSCPL